MRKTHGECKSIEHHSWSSMKARCSNPKLKAWSRYGGRGISVCERWRLFENFLADMGRRPTPQHTLDRIDNDGDYEPGNCRWATRKEQSDNATRGRDFGLRRNNSSGVSGVYYDSARRKWNARLGVGRRVWTLGRFDTKQDAADEVLLAKSYTKLG